MEKQRAFLKWAGGKYRLISEIQQHLPKKACLIEPFVGAGSVFLNTQFERYILADINPDLIHLFQLLQQDVERYIQAAKPLFEHPNANSREYYYHCRQRFNQSQDTFERSVLFLYLNRFGYNGLCRYNKQKQFNVPFGNYKKPYFPEKELRFFAKKAQQAVFICTDFATLFAQVAGEKNAVIYCDPPYAPLQQNSNFTHYAGGGFSLTQQQQLADLAKQSALPVLISNHDTPLTQQMYQGAKIKQLTVQRHIGQTPDSRRVVGELLALFD